MTELSPKPLPFREPIHTTLRRNVAIALVAGLIAKLVRHSPGVFVNTTILALWFSLGGHFIEIFFLIVLRQHLPPGRLPQAGARIVTWFLGGTLLTVGMEATARRIAPDMTRLPAIWVGGIAFVGVEILVHSVFRLRGKPGFFSGDG